MAEIVVGGLADALTLPVPSRVLVEIPSDLGIDDPHQELRQLVRASVGVNLGFRLLPDVRPFRAIDAARVDRSGVEDRLAGRTGAESRPNHEEPELLWSQGQLWLIDHGASLGFQHAWSA